MQTGQRIINRAFLANIIQAEVEEDMNAGEICTRTTVIAFKTMSVSEAARLMLEEHVGSLVIVEEEEAGRRIAGVLTDRDIVVAVVAGDFDARTMRVADIIAYVNHDIDDATLRTSCPALRSLAGPWTPPPRC